MNPKEFEELSKWVEKAQNGDEDAFLYLYEYTYKGVYFLVYNFIDNKSNVEDIVQEVYINILNSLGNLKDTKAFLGWVNSITYRCCLKSLKNNNLTTPIEDDESQLSEYIHREDREQPLDIILREEKNKILLDCIDKLPDKQKETLILRVYSELRYKEIAATMETSEHAVKKNLRSAKKNLKDIIEKLPNQQRNLFVLRSFSGFNVYWIIQVIKDMRDDKTSKFLLYAQKAAIGIGMVAVCGTGLWFGISNFRERPQVVSQRETIVSESNETIETSQDNKIIKEEPETTSDLPTETGISEEAIDITEEKSLPELLSWEVTKSELILYVEDESGIDYENTYGMTSNGRIIHPLRYEEEEGILFFDVYEEDFGLYLRNLNGDLQIWDLEKIN